MLRNQINGNLTFVNSEDAFSTTGMVMMDGERIEQKPIADLFPPEFHPFQVNDDPDMYRLAESIKENGVREPGLARPRTDGGYELLCGNRRRRACELAEIATMPVIIREMDDRSATIVMVESNLFQREKILPSEQAWAYKVMMEAINHNGVKGGNHSYEIMAERTGIKKSQLFRIIRLTELIVTLADKVDANQLGFVTAVELSYLSVPEQTAVADAMASSEIKPSHSQAKRLKELKKDGKLTLNTISKIILEAKNPTKSESTGSMRFRKFFPPDYSPKQIEQVISELLIEWKARVSA